MKINGLALALWAASAIAFTTPSSADALPDHSAWNAFVETNVANGLVAYGDIKKEPKELSAYLSALASTDRQALQSASEGERLAFWINAYNAYTIELVVENYPIQSIWDTSPFWKKAFGGPFAIAFIPLGHLFPNEPRNDKLTLNDIEHQILRKEFKEPRIHFAIVCASTSCPKLQAHAFVAADLDEQLTAAAREFMADTTKNRYDESSHRLELSSIFKWFRGDFEQAGGLVDYALSLLPSSEAQALTARAEAPEISFNNYDWTLNDRSR